MSFVDLLLGAIGLNAEVTLFGATSYSAEVATSLMLARQHGVDVAPSSASQILAPS
jgi:hypothetical protein